MAKLKNNTQLRRILALVGVMCVLVCALAPAASAYYIEGPSSRNFLFPMQYIATTRIKPVEDNAEWMPFVSEQSNSAYAYYGEYWYPTATNDPGSNVSQSNLRWSILNRENTSTNAIVEALVSPKSAGSEYRISLRSTNFIMPTSGSYNFNWNFGENVFPSSRSHIFRVVGTITVMEYSSASKSYNPVVKSFSAEWSGGVNCEMGNMVRNAINAISGFSISSYDYIYVNDLVMSFTTSAVELLEDGLYMTISSRGPSSVPTLSNYIRQFTFRGSDVGDTNFVGWLAGAIGDIFEIEIWPGFSLNELFNVVLVIGLVFWFLKLTV